MEAPLIKVHASAAVAAAAHPMLPSPPARFAIKVEVFSGLGISNSSIVQ